MASDARRLWQLIEPYHAITYFAPECADAFTQIGLRGFWRGYFAGRAAPFGAVGPGPITAAFFGFEPAFVERALPAIWQTVTPATAIGARRRGADRALGRLLPDALDSQDLAAAADLARRAITGVAAAGRSVFGANTQLDWPDAPHLVLWHAATLIREHRGDGHVAALVAAGIDPCEAHMLQVTASGAGLETIAPYRGWSDDDWAAAAQRLRERGWLDATGALTDTGMRAHDDIEATTDALAREPLDRLGTRAAARLLELLLPIARELSRQDAIRWPNPIGVPRP
ncbi:MAG TPA: hypothetical protein VH914_16160 [Acidimicrobiia bacterium]|nr:hypothetical protein [Acidimicrobiia bacterium]